MSVQDKWINFLYFAFKKAKHYVKNETSFVNEMDIIVFEENLDENIKQLESLLTDEDSLRKEIKKMKAHLYFVPKSMGSINEPRIRPKVTFPFKYQVLWAAVILYIGEWFDTNHQLKNVYSMREEGIREELEWMKPWSFNGRLKRLHSKDNEENSIPSYIQYNDRKIYESHQSALRNYHTYERQVINDLFKRNEKVYKAELDIHEFFPTLQKDKIKEALDIRFDNLQGLPGFKQHFFNPQKMKEIISILLFDIEIIYPDSIEEKSDFQYILKKYFDKINKNKDSKYEVKTISNLLTILNKTLPLDLIASNFLSNCALNHFVDTKVNLDSYSSKVYILRYTDDYAVISNDKKAIKGVINEIKELISDIDLSYSDEKTLPTNVIDVKNRIKLLKDENNWDYFFDNICESLEIDCFEDSKQLSDVINEKEKYKDLAHKLFTIGIDIDPERIDKEEIDNHLTLSRLSASSEINVKTLSDESLELYIQELITYMKVKGDVGELKEETAKIFAAWRLNATYREQAYRKNYTLEAIKPLLHLLEDAIKIYPYKLGYINIYLLVLLRFIDEDNLGYKELEDFFKKIKQLNQFHNSYPLCTKVFKASKRKYLPKSCIMVVKIN